MKIFISDLDGTLLDEKGCVPEKSVEILKRLEEKGVLFTVASARTPLSAAFILEPLRLRIPAILLNGCMLYDLEKRRILWYQAVGKEKRRQVIEEEKKAGLTGLLLAVEKTSDGTETLCMEPDPEAGELWEGYFDLERLEACLGIRNGFGDRDRTGAVERPMVYGLYMDREPGRLEQMAKALGRTPGLTLDFYKDIYRDSCWCLEIFSGEASKRSAALRLKKMCGADYLIGFGDGVNDLPLFEACDEAYAVSNGCEALKEAADRVIRSNLENGVALFMEEWEDHAENTDRQSLPFEHCVKGGAV